MGHTRARDFRMTSRGSATATPHSGTAPHTRPLRSSRRRTIQCRESPAAQRQVSASGHDLLAALASLTAMQVLALGRPTQRPDHDDCFFETGDSFPRGRNAWPRGPHGPPTDSEERSPRSVSLALMGHAVQVRERQSEGSALRNQPAGYHLLLPPHPRAARGPRRVVRRPPRGRTSRGRPEVGSGNR